MCPRLVLIRCIILGNLCLDIILFFMEILQYKASETGLTLPSTGIAAHAIDEDVEVVEMDDKFQGAAAASTGADETEVTLKIPRLPFLPPPPPIPQNAYIQVF